MILLKDQDQIVVLAASGDEKAFKKLFEAFQQPVFNYIYRMLGCVQDAADATQNVFLKVYKKLQSLRNPALFSTWLFSIARNEAVSLMRKNKRKLDYLQNENNTCLDIIDNQKDPAQNVMNKEFESIFQQVLTEIPEIYRSAFILGVLEEQSYEEVAKTLGCSVGNIKSRVFRARAFINKKLDRVYAV
ncbi:RNA polymerase sigma factor [candidate division KSB1 bacterium]|nr:RNA polymerase sigma factor [candidate division KSB1 bacterium]